MTTNYRIPKNWTLAGFGTTTNTLGTVLDPPTPTASVDSEEKCPVDLFVPKVYKDKDSIIETEDSESISSASSIPNKYRSSSPLSSLLEDIDSIDEMLDDIRSDDDYSDLGNNSIPESLITEGQNQTYEEGIKSQAIQLRELALAVNKAYVTLNTIKKIAVEEIVENKERYEIIIREMAEKLSIDSIIEIDELDLEMEICKNPQEQEN